VLVVGASAGIGKVIGQRLVREGAHVAFAARRGAACKEAAAEAGGVAVGLTCDVTDPELCERVVAETVEQLGRLDDLVYAAGQVSMIALAHADAGWWQRTLATNVIGAALLTRAALPHLQRSKGTAVYLSSVSSIGTPWPGIGVYTASKAALNRMVDTWRAEHPDVGFARVYVGPTDRSSNTMEFHESANEQMARWPGMHIVSGALIDPESIAHAVSLVLREPARVWDITVQPRDPGLPWIQEMPDPSDPEARAHLLSETSEPHTGQA